MSFQNYENPVSSANAVPPEVAMAGQPDPSTAPFGAPNPANLVVVDPSVAAATSQLNPEGKTTLWMGELEPWVDENFIRQLWYGMGFQVNVKMIRDRFSGSNAGYCFVDFATPAAAAKALTFNGQPLPNTARTFKLNWASGGGLADRSRDDRGPEYSIFVGDLGPEITEHVLVSLFQSRFPSCKSAKIMTDNMTGMSRGYGFVRFADETDQQRALTEMQGVYCGSRPMRISTATPKNKGPGAAVAAAAAAAAGMGVPPGMGPGPAGMYPPMGPSPMGYYGAGMAPAARSMNHFMDTNVDPDNTTVFVGGLTGLVTEDDLRRIFHPDGEITYVKVLSEKHCGFVQFVHRRSAQMAMGRLRNYNLGEHLRAEEGRDVGHVVLRLSWGRTRVPSGSAPSPYTPAAPAPLFGPSLGMTQPSYGGFGQMK